MKRLLFVSLRVLVGFLAVIGAVTLALVALAVTVGPPLNRPRVRGPLPAEIETHCAPITEWILAELERTGAAPELLDAAHLALLSELPYECRYTADGTLQVGQIGEFPPPLYVFFWSPELGWYWWSDSGEGNSEAFVDALLRAKGYGQGQGKLD